MPTKDVLIFPRKDESERLLTNEDACEKHGLDHDEIMAEVQDQDEYSDERPPERSELKSCDYCGGTHDPQHANNVEKRPTSILTNDTEPEYLCSLCYGQVVAQKIGVVPLDGVIIVRYDDGYDYKEVARSVGRDHQETLVLHHIHQLEERFDNLYMPYHNGEQLDEPDRWLMTLFPKLSHDE